MLVPLTEAKTRFHELIRAAQEEDVVVLRHGRPAAVLVSAERLDAILEELEDARDRIALFESRNEPADLNIPLEKLEAELGILDN